MTIQEKSINEKIEEYKKNKNLSYDDIGGILGISGQAVHQKVRGKRDILDLKFYQALSTLTGEKAKDIYYKITGIKSNYFNEEEAILNIPLPEIKDRHHHNTNKKPGHYPGFFN
jgi:transcriptional regulator with XRE-family HTH domain